MQEWKEPDTCSLVLSSWPSTSCQDKTIVHGTAVFIMQVSLQPQMAAMHLPTIVQQRALQQNQHRRDRDGPLARMQYLKASM